MDKIWQANVDFLSIVNVVEFAFSANGKILIKTFKTKIKTIQEWSRYS